nr:MAG TPA: hypothetical protein [Caudoviricetes sp.]
MIESRPEFEKISSFDEFNKYDARIIPISTIWREYIYPKFHISRETLYRILSTPIEEELEKVESRQLSLF